MLFTWSPCAAGLSPGFYFLVNFFLWKAQHHGLLSGKCRYLLLTESEDAKPPMPKTPIIRQGTLYPLVYHKADPGELIQWVTPESRSSAASNSGLIRIGTQPRIADAWHHDSCRPRAVVTRDFSAIFDRLFDRLPVRISTSDLHHWILRKKSFISELMILECSFPLR